MVARSAIVAAAAAAVARVASASSCTTQSQPNPIAAQYPNDVTGTTNGTLAILPIPYYVARSVIPSEYTILNHTIQEVIPSWNFEYFPVLLETRYDHGVQMGSIQISDFTGAGLYYPFVDRLGDGYTSFAYQDSEIITETDLIALGGVALYGVLPVPGVFSPSCDAYASDGNGGTTFTATTAPGNTTILPGKQAFNLHFKATSGSPYDLNVWQNLTGQPTFGDAPLICDNYIRFWNTTLEEGQYTPTPVKGTVTVDTPFAPTSTSISNVWGLQVDNAFIEHNAVMCSSLQGYEVAPAS